MKRFFKGLLLIVLLTALAVVLFSACNSGDASDAADKSAIASLLGGARVKGSDLPELDPEVWYLKLVNRDKPLPANFSVKTDLTADDYLFDERAISALDAMLAAGRSEGLQLTLTSAYRSYNSQNGLFQSKVEEILAEGRLSRKEAEELAAQSVARPGESEHNLGLAADIVCEYYGILDEGYADTAEAKWLREHCAEYGFILRYDKGKEDITNIIYEPWHFRYVGTEAADYMMKTGLCLEEFLESYK